MRSVRIINENDSYLQVIFMKIERFNN